MEAKKGWEGVWELPILLAVVWESGWVDVCYFPSAWDHRVGSTREDLQDLLNLFFLGSLAFFEVSVY